VLVQLEGHGRDGLFEDMDLTRSVGWFTNAYPLSLRLARRGERPGGSIKRIKEQLRQVPHKASAMACCATWPMTPAASDGGAAQARITFNYLGQFDQQFDRPRCSSHWMSRRAWPTTRTRRCPTG
jgi:hypothetical protein